MRLNTSETFQQSQFRRYGHPSPHIRLPFVPMIVTGIFLADDAEIVGNKLNVTGGVLDWMKFLPPPHNFWQVKLVAILQSSGDDADKAYHAKVEITHPETDSRVTPIEEEIQVDRHTGENRFWIWSLDLPIVNAGRHVITVTVGASATSIAFRADAVVS